MDLTPFYERDGITIYCGDCLEVMAEMQDNSIDTVITDPPYGLQFMGKKWDYDVPSIEIWEQCLRVLRPGGTALIFAGSRTQHRMAVNVEDAGFILKDCIMWIYGSGFPKATDISKQIDKRAGAEREIVQKRNKGTHKNGESYQWSQMVNETGDCPITAPATPDAQTWNGWKSHGLKPAYEPILVAMKPNEGSYADNALRWGVSGLNIDGGRIGTSDGFGGGRYMSSSNGNAFGEVPKHYQGDGFMAGNPQGRYPANIILDEEAAGVLDEMSISQIHGAGHAREGGNYIKRKKGDIWGDVGRDTGARYGDTGGASRFFYTAKASKSERGQNNDHCTVKPLSLMTYLSQLTATPTGGIILDPFMGSGTTLLAALNEGRPAIGIDTVEEYCEIAIERLRQPSLFTVMKPEPNGKEPELKQSELWA